jgi:hypothetical protein
MTLQSVLESNRQRWSMERTAVPPVVFQIGLTLVIVMYIIVLPIFFIRRDKFPIAQRLPVVVFAEFLLFIALTAVDALSGAYPDSKHFTNCRAYTVISTICGSTASAATGLRVCWLYIQISVTRNLVKDKNSLRRSLETTASFSPVVETSLGSAFADKILALLYKRMNRWQAAIVIISPALLASLFNCILVLLPTGSENLLLWDPRCSSSGFQLASILKTFMAFYYMVVFLFMLRAVFKVDDNFHLGTEMRVMMLSSFVLLAFNLLNSVGTYYTLVFVELKLYQFIHGLVYLPFVFVCSGIFPVYLSYQHASSNLMESPSKRETALNRSTDLSGRPPKSSDIAEVLENPQGRMLFLKFLQNEFSVENLLFYEEVTEFSEKYTEESNAEQMKKDAIRIFQTYVSPSAATSVNLPFNVRQPLIVYFTSIMLEAGQSHNDDYKQGVPEEESRTADSSSTQVPVTVLRHDIFDRARASTLRLMKQDSFVRFKKTKQYKKFQSQQGTPASQRTGSRSTLFSSLMNLGTPFKSNSVSAKL